MKEKPKAKDVVKILSKVISKMDDLIAERLRETVDSCEKPYWAKQVETESAAQQFELLQSAEYCLDILKNDETYKEEE